MDRIDLYVDVDEVKHSSLLHSDQEESSQIIRERVAAARKRQLERYGDPLKSNSALDNREIKKLIRLSEAAEQLLNDAAGRLGISARSYMRTLKVAQTIADLGNAEKVETSHIGEALQYRRQTDMAA